VRNVPKGSMSTPVDVVLDKQGYLYTLCRDPQAVWIGRDGAAGIAAISTGFVGANGGLGIDDAGTVYLAHGALSRLRCAGDRLTPGDWIREEMLPSGLSAVDGPRGTATTEVAWALAVTAGGAVYFVDQHSIRRMDRSRT